MFRHEIKAIITPIQAEILKAKVGAICFTDPHAGELGQYNIKSIYFDTKDDRFLEETLAGVNSRHKYRIRKYNDDNQLYKLERKSTENGLKHKDADLINREEVEQYIQGVFCLDEDDDRLVVSSFANESIRNSIRPVLVIGYDRVPFVYPVGNVRVTFDYNICATNDFQIFFEGYNGLERQICRGGVVVEIKYDEILPGVIADIINTSGIVNHSAFSKYANARLAFDNQRIDL